MKKSSLNGSKTSENLTITAQQAIIDKQKKEIFYLKSIIKKLPGSVYWKNKEGVYLGCNDFVLDMAGTKEVIGKTDYDLPWSEYAQEIYTTDRSIIEANMPIEIEEHPTLANGQQVIMLTNKTPLKDEQGNTVGIIGISVDITEKKQQEQQKSAFLNIVSHEIRGPLSNIQGLLEAMKLTKNSNKQIMAQMVDDVVNEVKRATDLLSDMVDLFDPEFTKDDVEYVDKVNVRDVIESIRPEITFKATTEFMLELSPNLPDKIRINVIKLRNILKILLQNSADQTQQGSIKLMVNVIKQQDKPALYIELMDTSPGIYPENKDHVFNALGRNERLDKDFLYHKPHIKLTMAKRLIESLGGTISLMNHPKQGAEFEVVIPYQAVDAALLTSSPISEKSAFMQRKQVTIPTGFSVLVVEDDKTTNQLLTTMFQQFHCKVKQAYTGEEALALLHQQDNRFDIVSMDITLPDINGTQVFKRMSCTQMPVVAAITSHTTKADVDYFYAQGFMAVLTKPVDQEDVEELLKTYTRMLQDN
jgi:two-component system aerobic respiration control sensor histidine kinase ArcB